MTKENKLSVFKPPIASVWTNSRFSGYVCWQCDQLWRQLRGWLPRCQVPGLQVWQLWAWLTAADPAKQPRQQFDLYSTRASTRDYLDLKDLYVNQLFIFWSISWINIFLSSSLFRCEASPLVTPPFTHFNLINCSLPNVTLRMLRHRDPFVFYFVFVTKNWALLVDQRAAAWPPRWTAPETTRRSWAELRRRPTVRSTRLP